MSAPKCKLCGKPHWLNEPHAFASGLARTRGPGPLVPVSRLAELEAAIENGLQAFREAGWALAQIRDAGLYRAEYGTFEVYCKSRWGFTSERARQLMSAAKIPTIVGVTNEGQARALAPLVGDVEAAQHAVDSVQATGAKVTARALSDAVRRRLQPQLEVTTEEPYRPRVVTCPECGDQHQCAGPEV